MSNSIPTAATIPYEPLPALTKYNLVDDPARDDNRGKRIGILIVAYNAVTTLSKVLKRVPPSIWRNVEEVAVFDDASQDSTYELALGVKNSLDIDKLTVIGNRQNLGYGGNQKAGYKYFMDKGFDVVVLLHGDGQYAPEVLSQLYHPLVTGEVDAVFGSRMMRTYGGPIEGGMPLYKYLGNTILTHYENLVLGMNLTEFHSGYRAYSLAALRQIQLGTMTDDFHFDTEIIIKLHHQGFRIKEVPIPTYYGGEICYVNGMKYAWDVTKSVWRYRKTTLSVANYSEFSEYFVHYPIKESRYSSHYYFQRLAGTGQCILEIGCGEGYFAERLAARGNQITGVDMLENPVRRQAFEKYYSANLSHGLGDVKRVLTGQRFDKILLMDVLEHLESPERVLEDCLPLLKPNGQLLISLPNVANVTVRLMLLFGRFNMTERGILDRTHLKFFTRKTARKLIDACQYEIVQEKSTVMPLELALGISPHNPLMILLNRLLRVGTSIWPTLFGYQFIFVARRRQP